MSLKLVLIGYMGAGKTSIGRKLSRSLCLPFYDLDSLIVNYTSETINDFFLKKGEIKFREIEHIILKKFLKFKKIYILSVGGGTPCYYDNMLLMNNVATTIYLKTKSSILSERLKLEKDSRPIISNFNNNDISNFISSHLLKREIFYNKSNIIINTYNKSKNIVVNEIKKKTFLIK